MNKYKEMYERYNSEYLLEKRALGSALPDLVHEAIEQIFAERGEHLPPRPHKPIKVSEVNPPGDKGSHWVKSLSLFALALFGLGVAKAIGKTWFGIPVAGGILLYWFIDSRRKESLTAEQREAEEDAQRAKDDGLNELMICAAKGDVIRARDLVAYGADVNALSNSGATALVYAARNNHRSVAEFLISVGADVNATTVKGSTAAATARRFGHEELASYLDSRSK